jgi:primosomal protein N''
MRVPVFPIIQRHLFQQIGFLFDSYLQESEENVEALLV